MKPLHQQLQCNQRVKMSGHDIWSSFDPALQTTADSLSYLDFHCQYQLRLWECSSSRAEIPTQGIVDMFPHEAEVLAY